MHIAPADRYVQSSCLPGSRPPHARHGIAVFYWCIGGDAVDDGPGAGHSDVVLQEVQGNDPKGNAGAVNTPFTNHLRIPPSKSEEIGRCIDYCTNQRPVCKGIPLPWPTGSHWALSCVVAGLYLLHIFRLFSQVRSITFFQKHLSHFSSFTCSFHINQLLS